MERRETTHPLLLKPGLHIVSITHSKSLEAAEKSLAFGAVRNFKLTLIERILNATWDPPEGASTCVGKYVIQAWDQNNAMIEDETNETYYVFSPVVGCMTYNVQVKPWVNQSMEGSTSLQTLSAGDLCKASLVALNAL